MSVQTRGPSERAVCEGVTIAGTPLWRELSASIDARAERMIEFRRRLHATPEPSGEELATTALVAEALREAGLSPRVMRGEVGVVADLDLGGGETFIALRAELDAVRVNDDKQVPYASTRPGLCHACGHDAHTTMVLSAALALAERRGELREAGLRHNIRFIFQPAEESATGARSMIEQGAIDGVEAIIALHVEPFLPTGVLGVRRGAMTAACKTFRIIARGRSGHSARPHQTLDPIPAAINIASLLYQLAPRSIDSRHPLALTVTSIESGSSFNVVPDQAVIRGTLRTVRVEDVEAVQERMETIVRGIAEATGCEIALEFPHHAPATENDDVVVDVLAAAATDVLGTDSIHWLESPSMGGEDFAFYQGLIPGGFARLGVGGGTAEGGPRHPLHSSLFDIDEASLPLGVKVLTHAAHSLARSFAPNRP